jgi:hypothetical protein
MSSPFASEAPVLRNAQRCTPHRRRERRAKARHCPPGPVCRAPVAHDKPGEVEPPCGQSAFSPGAVCRCSCGRSAERRRVCAMRRVSVTCKRGGCGTLKHVFERLTVFARPDPIDPVVCSMARAQHQAMPRAHSKPAGTASRHHAERQRARITPSGHVCEVARCRTRAHNTGAGLHGSLKRWAVELHERDLVDDLVHTCGRRWSTDAAWGPARDAHHRGRSLGYSGCSAW